MTAELTQRQRFTNSLQRCVRQRDFIPTFYERFVASSDEIKRKFIRTDFEQQHVMLARSLALIAGANEGDQEALRELSERGRTHDRDHLNIEPRHYDAWKKTVIETAREFDSQWDDATEAAWESILSTAVKHMLRKY